MQQGPWRGQPLSYILRTERRFIMKNSRGWALWTSVSPVFGEAPETASSRCWGGGAGGRAGPRHPHGARVLSACSVPLPGYSTSDQMKHIPIRSLLTHIPYTFSSSFKQGFFLYQLTVPLTPDNLTLEISFLRLLWEAQPCQILRSSL